MKAEEVTRRLDGSLAELEHARGSIEADGVVHAGEGTANNELDHSGQHPADLASEVNEREAEVSLLAEVEREIDEIRAAQQRLADGRYGVCVVCNEPIPEERLEAIPWARYCLVHQGAHERGEL